MHIPNPTLLLSSILISEELVSMEVSIYLPKHVLFFGISEELVSMEVPFV